MTDTMTAIDAINASATEDRIVHLPHDVDVMTDLLVESDDHVDTMHGTEYWGTTDTGAPWRVHVGLDIAGGMMR